MANVLRCNIRSADKLWKLANSSANGQCLLDASSGTLNVLAKRSVMILKRKVKLPHQPTQYNRLLVGPFLRQPRYKEPRPVADFIYEEVEDSEKIEESKLRLILLTTVDELGVQGDIVEVERNYGRFQLLSSKSAVYASEYNLKKYRELIETGAKDRKGPSSAYVMTTVKKLRQELILVAVNDVNPWTITTKHLRVAFRAAGYSIPEECIELPKEPISGPDVEGKHGLEFVVGVTINNQEKVDVRCMIIHKATPLPASLLQVNTNEDDDD